MASDGRPVRLDERLRPVEAALTDLLDPVALEERLKEARIRRSAALARKAAEPGPPPPAPPFAPPTPLAEAAPPAPARAPAEAPAPPRRRAGVPLWLTFVAGLLLGAAAVALVVVPRAAREAPARTATAEPPSMSTAPDAPSEAARVATVAPAHAASPAPGVDTGQPAALPVPDGDAAALPAAALATADLPAAPPAPDVATAAAGALPARVSVHYPASAAAAAEAAAAVLRQAGTTVETVPVSLAIARSNVRFYHPADRTTAAGIVGLLAFETSGDAPQLRDFTDYATPPAPGKVEVWLAGTPPEPGRAASRPASPAPPLAAPAQPAAPPPAVPLPRDQAEAVARIIVERAYERLLRGRED